MISATHNSVTGDMEIMADGKAIAQYVAATDMMTVKDEVTVEMVLRSFYGDVLKKKS